MGVPFQWKNHLNSFEIRSQCKGKANEAEEGECKTKRKCFFPIFEFSNFWILAILTLFRISLYKLWSVCSVCRVVSFSSFKFRVCTHSLLSTNSSVSYKHKPTCKPMVGTKKKKKKKKKKRKKKKKSWKIYFLIFFPFFLSFILF